MKMEEKKNNTKLAIIIGALYYEIMIDFVDSLNKKEAEFLIKTLERLRDMKEMK